jgi:alkaline phosphatase
LRGRILEKGGKGSITQQLLATRPDVTMGGGAETFTQAATAGDYQGKTLEAQAKERGYQIVRTASELTNVSKADQDAPVLGLFADGVKGFFLQVEGASIDKRDHAADPCGQIGETVDFDEAVQKALEFAKKDGNTLVVATADHGHSSRSSGCATSCTRG